MKSTDGSRHPTISIVTVVFNARDSLERTIDSVRSQEFPGREFVVIDGGSTDGTLELLHANSDVVDVLVSESDEGLYDAMNKGKDVASGDYAIFVNAGDQFVSTSVLADAAALMNDPGKFYFGNTIIYFDAEYRIAPDLHHQSIFFPRSFLQAESYASDKYEITAEGDYIYRMAKQLQGQHLDVDTVFSRIEGLRVHCYSTVAGTRKIYSEVTKLMRSHGDVMGWKFRLTYPMKSIAKYVAFKAGGLEMVARILLRSYRASQRVYDTGALA